MRKITSVLFLVAACCFSFSGIDNQEQQVKKAAQDQLQATLAMIPAGQEPGFGFASREQFQSATIDEVYRTISFTNEFYQEQKLTDKNYIRVQNEWRVPVLVDGDNRVLLTVFGQDTSLNVVDIGGTLLAKELQIKSEGQSEKDKFILRVYPLAIDFVVFVAHGKTLAEGNYYPMNSARAALPSLTGTALTQTEIFSLVKKALAAPSKN
jgi:hypothetical protein